MGRFAFPFDKSRAIADRMKFFEIKSQKSDAVVNLDAQSQDVRIYDDWSERLKREKFIRASCPGPTIYDRSVLSIQKGDMVRFSDGREFRVGEFLGAGNATHIFALGSHSVLRIPFASDSSAVVNEDSRSEIGIRLMRKFIGEAHSYPDGDRVEILEYADDYSWVVAERIDVEITADYYLEALKGTWLLQDSLPEFESMRLHSLLEFISETVGYQHDLNYLVRNGYDPLRNIAWSRSRLSWVWIDWE